MNELQKLETWRRDLALADTIEEIKMHEDAAAALAQLARRQHISLDKQNQIGRYRNDVEVKKGDWLKEHFGSGEHNNRGNQYIGKVEGSHQGNPSKMPTTKRESARARKIAKTAKENGELLESIQQKIEDSGDVITPQKVYSEIKKEERKKEKEDRINEIKQKAKEFNSQDIEIIHGDFRDIDIEKGSIDLILTDPPYPKEYLSVWKDLFLTAKQVLKPNGFLIAYSGQMYLDKIFEYANQSGLNYYWMASIEFTEKPLIHGRNVINEWKPILIFQNGLKKSDEVFGDKILMPKTERDLHNLNWGQTVEPFEFLLDRFSNEMDLVFDPFAGSGTTALACKKKKRRCIAVEVDLNYIDIIKGRL